MLQLVKWGMTTPLIMTRAQAKAAGLTRYYTGQPCVNGHIADRFVCSYSCTECVDAWNKSHPVVMRAARGRWLDANLDARAAYLAENKAERLAVTAAWREANRARVRAVNLAYQKANPELVAVIKAARSPRVAQATPAWVDWRAVKQVYSEAASLTRMTGIPHHVDHIVPIRGRNVCGLHVHNNLRAVPADVNRRKHNKLED
jgi:hypothetical protein